MLKEWSVVGGGRSADLELWGHSPMPVRVERGGRADRFSESRMTGFAAPGPRESSKNQEFAIGSSYYPMLGRPYRVLCFNITNARRCRRGGSFIKRIIESVRCLLGNGNPQWRRIATARIFQPKQPTGA